MTPEEEKEEALLQLALNPIQAHLTLFPHRHTDATPKFHGEMILDIHSDRPNVLLMAFRGAAKSTLLEEAIVINACFRRFRNFLIIGETYERACDRLRAIKREFEYNTTLESLFGSLLGPTWHESKIELSTGVVIQCAGQGQAVRGTKHIDIRPEYLAVDDLESKDTVSTKEARRKLSNWVTGDLIPACVPNPTIRVAATPLDPEAWAVKLTESREWKCGIFPIEYVDDSGERRATWPSRFPLPWVDKKKESLFRSGNSVEWEQEYMCRAIDPATRVFFPEYIRVEPLVRSWHPVLASYDPARTINKSSASTGRVVGSWVGSRLVIWEASAPMWLPDAITNDIFDVDARYSPIKIGIEQDGLHEFLMQPLRAAMVQRGRLLPIEPLKAPKGKLDFIKSLQPFFKAGDIIFAGADRNSFQDIIDQLMSFPTGRIDAPNALAYLLTLRPGMPVYEDFSQNNISPDVAMLSRTPLFLCLNSGSGATSAALCELVSGQLVIHADWLREGDPGATIPGIFFEVRALAGRTTTVYGPREHFTYSSSGMKAAMRAETTEFRRGGEIEDGREVIRAMLGRSIRGLPALRVAPGAEWCLRAFAGGYARKLGLDEPIAGVYRVLMEGLESWAATLRAGQEDIDVRYSTAGGRRYISARSTGDNFEHDEQKINGVLSG
jgi:hypothetical protein